MYEQIVSLSQASDDDLRRMQVAERFKVIGDILKHAFSKAAARGFSDVKLKPQYFPREYLALKKLAASFSHSDSFKTLIRTATEKTLDGVKRDGALLDKLNGWQDLPPRERKASLRRIMETFIAAANTQTGIRLIEPRLEFFDAPKSDGSILQGNYESILRGASHLGTIRANQNADAGFNDVVEIGCTIVHESIHATDDQIGHKSLHMPALVHAFGHDCHLWRYRETHGATIPYTMDKAYTAQYHEQVAYGAEPLFAQGLRAMLG